jgi:hypothetical protein
MCPLRQPRHEDGLRLGYLLSLCLFEGEDSLDDVRSGSTPSDKFEDTFIEQ